MNRQQELTVGTCVRLVNTATQKAKLRGTRKMQERLSQEVFTTASVSKQSWNGSGNVRNFAPRSSVAFPTIQNWFYVHLYNAMCSTRNVRESNATIVSLPLL